MPNLLQNSERAMRIYLEKGSVSISISITIALMLIFSAFQGNAQGQSSDKLTLNQKVQNSYDRYVKLLKANYGMPAADTLKDSLKKKSVQGGNNSMKRIKKGVSYMLISQSQNEIVHPAAGELPLLPQFTNYARYEEII